MGSQDSLLHSVTILVLKIWFLLFLCYKPLSLRKEIDSNSKQSRSEIDNKLDNINKQINDYHKSSSVSITQQFKESNKVIKDVTSELEKIKGFLGKFN